MSPVRTTIGALLLSLGLAATAGAKPIIEFSGSAAPDVEQTFVESQYFRIWRQVAPARPVDQRPLHVIFYTSRARPAAAAWLPEWGGGGTVGPDTIVVPLDVAFAVQRNLTQVVVHEIVHATLNRAYPHLALPRWFHEGCAMLLSGEVSFDEQTALSWAVLAGHLPRLGTIDAVNASDRQSAAVAYSYSHACVQLLVDSLGIDVLASILNRAERRASLEAGLQAATGLSLPEFETIAAAGVSKRYGLAFIFGDLYWIWLLILALAIVVFVILMVRRQRRAKEMEMQEAVLEVSSTVGTSGSGGGDGGQGGSTT